MLETSRTENRNSGSLPISNPPDSLLDKSVCLEDYLDHVCAPLVGVIHYEARIELRAEMQEHLMALVMAYQEIGETEEQAAASACRQFGDPLKVAEQWRTEWERTEPAKVPSSRPAALLAFSLFGAGSLFASGILWLLLFQPGNQNTSNLLQFLTILALPLLAGVVTGAVAPARPGLGVFWALSLLILPTTALAGYLAMERGDWSQGAMLGALQLVFWMPIGCVSAELTGWLRRRSLRSLRRWAL